MLEDSPTRQATRATGRGPNPPGSGATVHGPTESALNASKVDTVANHTIRRPCSTTREPNSGVPNRFRMEAGSVHMAKEFSKWDTSGTGRRTPTKRERSAFPCYSWGNACVNHGFRGLARDF